VSRYLLVKGKAGMGNRMRALARGLVYARLSGRKVVVDWSDPCYSSRGENVFGRLFQRCEHIVERPLEELEELAVVPALWKGKLRCTALEMQERHCALGLADSERYTSVDVSRLDHPEALAVMHAYAFKGRELQAFSSRLPEQWQSLTSDGLLGLLLRTELRVDPDIAAAVAEFERTRFHPPMVGVHVRFSDNVQNQGRVGQTPAVDLERYLGALDTLVAEERPPGIFLATDSRRVEALITERYGNVVSTSKWFPGRWERLHDNESCPDRSQVAREALVDLYLLAACRWLVYSAHSSFGCNAALLAEGQAERRSVRLE
jgi:hypothetical protein